MYHHLHSLKARLSLSFAVLIFSPSSLDFIRDLSAQTSAGGAQITASAQQLTELAADLRILIGAFKPQQQ